MSLLVTGTIGIDTVETPHGRADNILGGSAAYFALAAGLLSPVRLVGVVGDDFPQAFLDIFKGRPIDTAGLEVRKGSKTFRWHGKYLQDMNQRETISTDLNVIAEEPPKIPAQSCDSKYVFLANTHPAIQFGFIQQLTSPKLIVCDTMNLWISDFRDDLLKTLSAVDGIVLNDEEATMITGKNDLILAGRDVLKLGPKFAVIKKGAHGAILVTPDELFVIPAFLTTKVNDPTGAGDSFAGGMMGYLAAVDRTDTAAIRAAMARGTCTASITIEDFSLNSIAATNEKKLDARLAEFRNMLAFE